MIFRKQKPGKSMRCWAKLRFYSDPVIVWFDKSHDMAFEVGSNRNVTSEITHWGYSISTPSVELEGHDACDGVNPTAWVWDEADGDEEDDA